MGVGFGYTTYLYCSFYELIKCLHLGWQGKHKDQLTSNTLVLACTVFSQATNHEMCFHYIYFINTVKVPFYLRISVDVTTSCCD